MPKASLVDGKIKVTKDGDAPDDKLKDKGQENQEPVEKKKRYKVIINQQDSFDGKYDVPLGVNGVVHQIKRGQEVILDEDYLQVLKDSIIDQVVQDGEGNDEVIQIARYSFSVLGEV